MKIVKILLGNPLRAGALIFLSVSMPINHFFLEDYPNNPLERMEEYVISMIIGIDVDMDKEEERIDQLIDDIFSPTGEPIVAQD